VVLLLGLPVDVAHALWVGAQASKRSAARARCRRSAHCGAIQPIARSRKVDLPAGVTITRAATRPA
jgi:hypothetical protein